MTDRIPELHRVKINKRVFLPVYVIENSVDGSLCRGYVPIDEVPQAVTQEMRDAPVVLEVDLERAIMWIKFGESKP